MGIECSTPLTTNKVNRFMKEEHKPFIRISWEEAEQELMAALKAKYKAKGEIKMKKNYGYDGIGDFYDSPDYVDIYLNN